MITIYTLFNSQRAFEIDKSVKTKDFHKEIIKNIKSKYYNYTGKKIEINFVDGILQPSIMFALLNNIYINTNKRYSYKSIEDIHFEGILAHEVGHSIHMSRVYAFANLRLTAIIGNYLFVDTINSSHRLKKSKSFILSYILFGFKYLIFILFNLLNLIILYPFKRFEELAADKLSLSVSNGYSLRGYYFKILKNHNSKLERFRFNFIDFNHPNPKKHYNLLNDLMKFSNKNCELYRNNDIYVKDYLSASEKYNKILEFVEKDVLLEVPSTYQYFGRLASDNQDFDKAKYYYKLAGESGQLNAYRRLIKILIGESDLEAALDVYKILADKGDKDALIFTTYYHKEFNLFNQSINGEIVETIDNTNSIQLSLNNEAIIKQNNEVTNLFFNRNNNQIYLSDSKVVLLNQGVITLKYKQTNDLSEENLEIIESYK